MLIHPQIDPVALGIGPLKIHWYGLMYFIGFLSFIHLGKKQIINRHWFNLNEKILDDTFFFGAIGVIQRNFYGLEWWDVISWWSDRSSAWHILDNSKT